MYVIIFANKLFMQVIIILMKNSQYVHQVVLGHEMLEQQTAATL